MAEQSTILDEAVRSFSAGDFERAAGLCRAVLASNPQNVRALDLLGMIARAKGDHAGAVDLFTRATLLEPTSALLHLHRGLALRSLPGSEREAIEAFRRAVAVEPASAEAHHQLGNAQKAMARFADAVASLSEAARLAPKSAVIALNLGVAQLELERLPDAIASFRRAIAIEPSRPEAHNVLGTALHQYGELTAAAEAFAAALRLRPGYAGAHNNLARVLRAQGRIVDALREFRAALAAAPDPATHSNLLYTFNFSPDISAAEIAAEHRQWNDRYAKPLAKPRPSARKRDARSPRLRVGFVSADFVNHAVAYFFETVAMERDRSAWELICYSDVRAPDRVTERLRAASDDWHDCASWSDDRLAAQVREDRIDVLIDLAGHTARNRLLAFARRPAPMQATWLGYPNTTGLEAMDFRITDAIADPLGATEPWHTEKLVRLPETFLCYRPPAMAPAIGPVPAVKAGHVTFGSFSNFAKISAPCLAVWAQVLRAVDGSRLVLKSRGLDDVGTAGLVRERLRGVGIDPARVVLDGNLTSVADHLALYNGIDIALDPFPYNGTTTTCEALWMGVPVVTLAGETHVARVGVSLLTNLGAPDWSAANATEYVARCVALAGNLPALAAIRAEQRERMRRSPLCDGTRFMRHFEAALQAMARREK